MKSVILTLIYAFAISAVMGGGCFCGALGAGIVCRKGPTPEEWKFVAAQVEEMQATLESLVRDDYRPIDEFAGLGEEEAMR